MANTRPTINNNRPSPSLLDSRLETANIDQSACFLHSEIERHASKRSHTASLPKKIQTAYAHKYRYKRVTNAESESDQAGRERFNLSQQRHFKYFLICKPVCNILLHCAIVVTYRQTESVYLSPLPVIYIFLSQPAIIPWFLQLLHYKEASPLRCGSSFVSGSQAPKTAST